MRDLGQHLDCGRAHDEDTMREADWLYLSMWIPQIAGAGGQP